MPRVNPRTFTKDAAERGVSNLGDLIAQLGRHPGLRRRDATQLAQRWACRLGLLGRWKKQRIEAEIEQARVRARQAFGYRVDGHHTADNPKIVAAVGFAVFVMLSCLRGCPLADADVDCSQRRCPTGQYCCGINKCCQEEKTAAT